MYAIFNSFACFVSIYTQHIGRTPKTSIHPYLHSPRPHRCFALKPMSSWDGSATISTFLTLGELSDAAKLDDKKYETSVLAQLAEARDKGYDALCLPLTTEKWKNRWSDMCLLPTGSDKDAQNLAELQAEAWRSKPCFLQDEVTVTRLGKWDCLQRRPRTWSDLDLR